MKKIQKKTQKQNKNNETKRIIERGHYKKTGFYQQNKRNIGDITLDEETENEIIKCVAGIYQEKEKDYLIEFIERN